jgi:hypothetical protein
VKEVNVMRARWVVLVFVACQSVQSKDLETSGLYAKLEADAPGTGQVNVRATLSTGQGSVTSFELVAPDALTASVGSTARAMTRHSMLGSIWYDASFDGDAAGTTVKVSLSRPSRTSAPESVVTLPTPFSITGPNPNDVFPRGGGVTLTWNVSGDADPLRVTARGACIQPVDVELTRDEGTHTFARFTPSVGNKSETCVVDLTLVRTRAGVVDRAYGKGGSFTATVTRSMHITSTP